MSGLSNHITVLMPVYNGAKYIRSAIKSILHQTHKSFEFLIIDDGSTDDTEEIVSDYKDSRINYKKTPHCGLPQALNFGLKNSCGDWIARIDADDINTHNRLEEQISFINKNPRYDVISSWSVYFRDPYRILFFLDLPVHDEQIKKFLNLHNPINHSSVIFNKKRILDLGGYSENFKCYEDFELWLRIKDAVKFRILPQYLTYTRLRKSSLTNTGKTNDIYRVLLQNAVTNLSKISSCQEKIYWENILFRIEYFFGDKKKSRISFKKEFSFKDYLVYASTLLPDGLFEQIKDFRLRHRLNSVGFAKRQYGKELQKLI